MEGWEDTSADEAEEVNVRDAADRSDDEGGEEALRPKQAAVPKTGSDRPKDSRTQWQETEKAKERNGRSSGGRPGTATASRLNQLASSHVERNRKLEQRKAELERQKVEAEEASMVQWNAKKTPGRAKRGSAKKSRPSDDSIGKPPTAPVQGQPHQPGTTAAPAVSTSKPSPNVDGANVQRPGFALPDVTPAEFEVFVEAVRGYQGHSAPAGSSPASGATMSPPSQSAVPAGNASPSLEALATEGKVAADGLQQITITELPDPAELQQQQQQQQQQQRRRQQQQQREQQRSGLRKETKPPVVGSKTLVTDPGRFADTDHAGPIAPPSPGSMGDISRAVADAREADEEGDRRTAWMLHMEAVRVYQAAARRCPGGAESWPAELRAEQAKIVARTAALKSEVEQQAQGGRVRSNRSRSGGLFACCGSKRAASNGSPGRPARGAAKAAAVADENTAALSVTTAAGTDGPMRRPASTPVDSTGRQRGSTRSNSANRAADSRSRSPAGGLATGRGGRREYSPRGADFGPVSTKATTTQREIQNLHDGLPTKPASSGAIKITVKTLTAGESYTVRIGQTASVDALKASVEAVEGTEAALQRLAIMTSDGSATRQLSQGSALLSDYDLQDGSTLLLVKRLGPISPLSTSMCSENSISGQDYVVKNNTPRGTSQNAEDVTGSDGESPAALSVVSSTASESRIPVHRRTPPRNTKSVIDSTQSSSVGADRYRQRQALESSDDDHDDGNDAEKENAMGDTTRAIAEEEEGAGVRGATAANDDREAKRKVAAAAAQAERLRRLSEPVRPRGLELNKQSSSTSAEEEKKKTPKKKVDSSSSVTRKRSHLARKAELTGAATPKGAATKTTAELKREKAEAEAEEQEAKRKAEAWKRKRARDAARKAASQARADAARSRREDTGDPDSGDKEEEEENRRTGRGRCSSSKLVDGTQAKTGKPPNAEGKDHERHKAKGDAENNEKSTSGIKGRADGCKNSGKERREEHSQVASMVDGSHSLQRTTMHSESGHSRGYLSSTSDSYSEESDDDYIHTVRSAAPVQSSAAVVSASEAGRTTSSKLSLVAPPARAVQPRPILSSMSLGFPGGSGETTKGGVLFSTASFGAITADVSGVDAVLCDPEHAAGEELRNAEQLHGCVAVARRGESSFAAKARRVQAAGALALFVVNSDDDLFVLDGDGAGHEDDITIPVVMAGATESFRLLAQLRAVAEAAEGLRRSTSDVSKTSGRTGADFAPLISFTYDLNGPDGGGEAYADLRAALGGHGVDAEDHAPHDLNGVDWRVHMEAFGMRDSAGEIWVDGAGLMDALQCAFGWQATNDEIDELLEAAGTPTSREDGCDNCAYRLDTEGYVTVMQDFEQDFGVGALGSPGSSCEADSGRGVVAGVQPPPAWGEQAALALEEGYSS